MLAAGTGLAALLLCPWHQRQQQQQEGLFGEQGRGHWNGGPLDELLRGVCFDRHVRSKAGLTHTRVTHLPVCMVPGRGKHVHSLGPGPCFQEAPTRGLHWSSTHSSSSSNCALVACTACMLVVWWGRRALAGGQAGSVGCVPAVGRCPLLDSQAVRLFLAAVAVPGGCSWWGPLAGLLPGSSPSYLHMCVCLCCAAYHCGNGVWFASVWRPPAALVGWLEPPAGFPTQVTQMSLCGWCVCCALCVCNV